MNQEKFSSFIQMIMNSSTNEQKNILAVRELREMLAGTLSPEQEQVLDTITGEEGPGCPEMRTLTDYTPQAMEEARERTKARKEREEWEARYGRC